jgi:hypothetical protein
LKIPTTAGNRFYIKTLKNSQIEYFYKVKNSNPDPGNPLKTGPWALVLNGSLEEGLPDKNYIKQTLRMFYLC